VVENGCKVQVVECVEPLIGVIGAWRPRVLTAERVISVCSRDEFRQVVAHEAAHISTRDNLKLMLLVGCPDALALTALGATLIHRWRREVEFAADQRAAGDDPQKRLELAAALIKVARLGDAGLSARHALRMSVALDDVEGRIRQLLAPARATSARLRNALASLALLMPVAALPLYALVHELIENLVRFGL
jgi:beta-lactamase regulating signal transducer with metallopeptidase domain